ncbi:MAG: hypothetical protein KAY44_01650, partial [Neisseria sp.]|nr:hypothetical protein [Neisseria sp.]MBP8045293.1 hypothetical protein [Neisseria sp.]
MYKQTQLLGGCATETHAFYHSKTRPSERLMFQTALFFSTNTANPSRSNRVRGCATHPTAGRGFLFDFAQDCAASRLILLRRRNISRRF